jgi:hypothetical protein
VFEGALSFFGVSTPSGVSSCVAKSDVSLSGKNPSRFALFNALRQSAGVSQNFQCAGPITFPGFQADPLTNLLVLYPNGAARINGSSDLQVHVPSLNIEMSATIVVTAGQVSSIQATRFRSTRNFIGGFNDFRVALTDTGNISGVFLSLEHDAQPTQTQICGTF